MTHESLAKQLRLSEEEVDKAWSYWADMKAVLKLPNGSGAKLAYDIEYINLRELMYGSSSKKEAFSSFGAKIDGLLQNRQLKDMIDRIEHTAGKILSPKETEEIYGWMRDFQATPDIIEYAYQYCYEKGKTNFKYISKVVAQWTKQGFKTEEDVKAFLEGLDQRYAVQKRILQALGMNRSATEAEKELIDTWFDQMHFNLERVLEACGKTVSIANPNLRYVNKVLENWYQEAKADGRDVNKKVTVTQSVLNKYYEYLRKREMKGSARKKRSKSTIKIPPHKRNR